MIWFSPNYMYIKQLHRVWYSKCKYELTDHGYNESTMYKNHGPLMKAPAELARWTD